LKEKIAALDGKIDSIENDIYETPNA
jgi:hypothetical protein